jgi:hypothetical protein
MELSEHLPQQHASCMAADEAAGAKGCKAPHHHQMRGVQIWIRIVDNTSISHMTVAHPALTQARTQIMQPHCTFMKCSCTAGC